MASSYIIGLSGGSASGKTFFINELRRSFKHEDLCIISQDNYYLEREHQPLDGNGVTNFDTLQSIDFEEFNNDLQKLISGSIVNRAKYTYNNPAAQPEVLSFHPSPITIVEGIFIFHNPELKKLYDLKVFIDTEEDIKLERRILRDGKERGYDKKDILYRHEHHVMPSYNKYIKPHKKDVDIVIPNNNNFSVALNVLVEFLKTKLE